jgi:hypothetical protein
MTPEEKVAAVFPETWTHARNINWLQVGWRLKLLGVWPVGMPLEQVLATCERLKLLLRDGELIRRGGRVPLLKKDDTK